MEPDWKLVTLGEALTLQRGFDLPKKKRLDGPFPIISSSGPSGFHNEFKVNPPGVVTGRYGTIGKIHYVDTDFWPLNTTLWVKDFKGNDPLFIYYLLHIIDYFQYSDKAAVPGINRNHVHTAQIKLPPLNVQKSIAHILGAFDDKIDLNRRMNQTLESMARAIFKSWFVDFDGCTKFQDSELGKIPKGWEIGKIKDSFNLTMGQSPPGKTYNEDKKGIPFFQGRRDFTFRYPTERVYCTEPKRLAKKNNTLVSVRAPVGDINMAKVDCCIGRGLAAVSHISGSRSFTYYSMLNLNAIFNSYESEGTVFGSINKKQFESLLVVLPPNYKIDEYNEAVSPIDNKIEHQINQTDTLIKLRDTLLPKLISGELRVPDAEKLAEEVL